MKKNVVLGLSALLLVSFLTVNSPASASGWKFWHKKAAPKAAAPVVQAPAAPKAAIPVVQEALVTPKAATVTPAVNTTPAVSTAPVKTIPVANVQKTSPAPTKPVIKAPEAVKSAPVTKETTKKHCKCRKHSVKKAVKK